MSAQRGSRRQEIRLAVLAALERVDGGSATAERLVELTGYELPLVATVLVSLQRSGQASFGAGGYSAVSRPLDGWPLWAGQRRLL